MNISINPWYYCNFRCHFCYLTEKQLSDKNLLPLEKLSDRLAEIQTYKKIEHVDLYGGEISLLPKQYLSDLKDCLQLHGINYANINTNLSALPEEFKDDFWDISVSYDFSAREQSDRVWKNMALLDKEFSVLMLASDKLISLDVDQMIRQFNLLNNLISVEIKPYSTNQANSLPVTFSQFEEFVKKWINSPVIKNFHFSNITLIENVLSNSRNSFSDDHVYITPSGNFAVLEFDLNDNEFFLEYSSFDQYLSWCEKEKSRVLKNSFCSKCEYFGRCLSEHLREVKDLENSCNGFKNLINWYASNRSI